MLMLIWQSSLEAPGTANTIMICSHYKLNMYTCLHACLCCKLLQLAMVKLERLVKPLNPLLLPSCQFLYRGSEVPPCSAQNVPGFGWRNAFGSNRPPPGVVDQADGHQKDACGCLAHLGTIRKATQRLVKHCQDEISTIRWFQQHHAPPSVQKPVKSSPPEPFWPSRHPRVGHRPFAELHWYKPSQPPSQLTGRKPSCWAIPQLPLEPSQLHDHSAVGREKNRK